MNGILFLEYKMTNGQALSVNVSKAMKAGNNNTIMLVGVGFSPNSSAQVAITGQKKPGDPLWPPVADIDW